MAKYIKGDAIPNARGYQLCKKVGYEYLPVASYNCGKNYNRFLQGCFLGIDGALNSGEASDVYTDFIHIDLIAEEIIKADIGWDEILSRKFFDIEVHNRGNVLVAFYTKYGDYNSCVGTLTFEDMEGDPDIGGGVGFEWENIKAYAENLHAKYIILSGVESSDPEHPNWVYFTDKIFFCLDAYPEELPEGETHYLVVKAIGESDGTVDTNNDGIIYIDSDHGGKNHPSQPLEPVEYTVEA